MKELNLSYVIEEISEKFKQRLKRKPNWGRHEAQAELYNAILIVLAELVNDQEELDQAGT